MVIPARNEEQHLGATLEALRGQDYPCDRMDVVVVDNGSTDGTVHVATQASVRVLSEPAPSSYRARNHVVLGSAAEYLAFIHADCRAEPSWLRALVVAAKSNGSRFVAGRTENRVERATLGARLLAIRATPETRRRDIEAAAVAAGNMLVAREVFPEHGLFDSAASGSDIESSRRASAGGERIAYAGSAVVWHSCDLSDFDYLRRSFRIAHGQAIHQRVGVGRCLARVPWRPGIARALELSSELGLDGVPGRVRLWLYLWADRVFAYLGGIAGAIHGRRRHQ